MSTSGARVFLVGRIHPDPAVDLYRHDRGDGTRQWPGSDNLPAADKWVTASANAVGAGGPVREPEAHYNITIDSDRVLPSAVRSMHARSDRPTISWYAR